MVQTMHTDQFEVRLAIVRHRFATTLESKIEAAIVSADHMSRGGKEGFVKHVSESYRRLHGICGSDQRSVSPPPARLRTSRKRP